MYKEDDLVRLRSVLSKMQDIQTIIERHGSITKALDDLEGQPAVLMLIVAISEQFAKLKKHHSLLLESFDKDDICGMIDVRNYIAHDYDGINLAFVEDDLRENFPRLKAIIESILNKS
jgi:uncharacterized protein with HEPN domain